MISRPRPLRCFVSTALLLTFVLNAGTAAAQQDGMARERESAKAWAMTRIAEIQAAFGDVQGAKRTVTQIGQDGLKGTVDVTGVWFCNGEPLYDHPPLGWDRGGMPLPGGLKQSSENWPRIGADGVRPVSFDAVQRCDDVPLQIPALPAESLAADPRHGAVVEFTDEVDGHGTRVISRRYADGAVVIETPRTGRITR